MRLTLAAAAAALLSTTTTPAHAASVDVLTIQGSAYGSTFSLTGPATYVGTNGVALVYSCSSSTITLGLVGVGTFTLTCGPLTLVCNYEQAGTVIAAECLRSGTFGVYAGDIVLEPHDVLPTTSYDIAAQFAGASV